MEGVEKVKAGEGEVCDPDPGVVSVSGGVRAVIGVKGIHAGGGKFMACLRLLTCQMMMMMMMIRMAVMTAIVTVAAIKKETIFMTIIKPKQNKKKCGSSFYLFIYLFIFYLKVVKIFYFTENFTKKTNQN